MSTDLADHRAALLAAAQAMADACTSEALRHTFGVELQPGERYAGTLLREDGTPSHHLVLLPGTAENVKWPAALAWAQQAGGDLPTRREQLLLLANCQSAFSEAWYWSCDESDNGSGAWYQVANNSSQGAFPKSYEGRAYAVRRVLASRGTDPAAATGDTRAKPPAAKKTPTAARRGSPR